MFIETEGTPNPATLKFLPGRDVMAQGTADYASPEAAAREIALFFKPEELIGWKDGNNGWI